MVLTGSCNFTKAAQDRNAENILVPKDPALTPHDIKNWEAHWARRQLYVGRRHGKPRGSHRWLGG
jgi:phosphatidylserine/phosphatidylglycerophosphate/cardiolipin synthase-like enzyme